MGNEAIVQGALEAGVDFVTMYPGCPSAEIGDEFGKIAKDYGIYYEISTNEKVALESAVGASFSGLKSLVAMKNFGVNVCSEVLLPLLYTGTKGAMVIVVGDDPGCWSSAQTEENSRAFSLMAHIPTLEPADAQECRDFVKLGSLAGLGAFALAGTGSCTGRNTGTDSSYKNGNQHSPYLLIFLFGLPFGSG